MESCFSCFYLAYCICESFAIWIGIFQKSYKKTKTTTNRQHTERGHLCVNYHYRYSYKFINGISAFSLGWIYTWRAFGLPTGRPYLTIFWNAGIAFNSACLKLFFAAIAKIQTLPKNYYITLTLNMEGTQQIFIFTAIPPSGTIPVGCPWVELLLE